VAIRRPIVPHIRHSALKKKFPAARAGVVVKHGLAAGYGLALWFDMVSGHRQSQRQDVPFIYHRATG
jgi:type IV secretory pathway TrbD component